jgi:phosphoglycolate phosphatase-like HAD superfamily hydrolase
MPMKSKNLIVFDMDGVIVDVSGSYRDTVRQTTRLFLSPAQNAELLPEPLFDLTDLAAVKQSGGLNNDWDLSFRIICLLFTLVAKPQISQAQDPWATFRKTLSCCDLRRLAEYLNSTHSPLTTLLQRHGKITDPFIAQLYTGDVGSGNIIKQIFQEIYLGAKLFTSTYHLTPEMYKGDGYILRETVLIDRSVLADFSKRNILSIATGRPKAEADYPLVKFDLKTYFKTICTLDDCLREEARILANKGEKVSLSKPNPFMLDVVAETHKASVNGFYYIGDMPDDMLAAAKSQFGYKSIGILISASDKSGLKNRLSRAGADYIVEDFDGLKDILL